MAVARIVVVSYAVFWLSNRSANYLRKICRFTPVDIHVGIRVDDARTDVCMIVCADVCVDVCMYTHLSPHIHPYRHTHGPEYMNFIMDVHTVIYVDVHTEWCIDVCAEAPFSIRLHSESVN